MTSRRQALTYTICAAVTFLGAENANAACTLAGKWFFYAMQGVSPMIKSAAVVVGNTTNTGGVTVKAFPSSGTPFINQTATAIKCVLTVAADGTVSTSPCTAYNAAAPTGTTNVSGKLNPTAGVACDYTGTLNVVGDTVPVTVRGLHLNGNAGAGIATQGPNEVFHFSLVKQ